ncbi:VWA domain-containing protein [Thiomicrorhabdus sp. ZW0627]|uniref:vWA domain-containing protein n=1 Tax=Thiomicrorhabdus sp. ZW0627 TaxID=3039774 RepID=UPI002437370F|nr:VWA domain-containing protein [Thiomicrorhabdus sp. ZW0627]MDG6774208.1 VWA domain-containing protein [Thiomicrorhabdus sp. ZW0627]
MQWFNVWQNFEFLWPWMLAFLPLPWIVRLLVKPVQHQQTALLAPQIVQRVSRGLTEESLIQPEVRSRRIPMPFALLWLLFILAAMRPIWYLTPTPFTASGKDMILAVDLSGSMQKADMYLNGKDVDRLTAVKSVVAEFIEQRKGDRMGLIVFGSQAFLQSPLTYDLNTVKTLLNETEIGMAGNNTAIGDAIGLTLKHRMKNHQNQSVLVLLTDGSNTAGEVDPIKAAKKAAELGLKIYTIGVGQVKHRTGLDAFFNGGKTDMDIDSLKKIAELTHGQFFLANDTQQLQQIYQSINRLESVEHEVHSYRLRSELYVWPLGLAFLISLLIGWLKLRQAGG